MNQVPKMISTKDLAYLSDMADWNFNAAKKCNHFANEVQDEEIKNMILQAFAMHKENFNKIMTILS